MSTTSTGKTLNLTIEDLGGMLIELRPLGTGGEPWDISGKTFYGELYDELTDEKVGDIECSVTGEGRVLSKFPEMGRGRYSFAVYASDSGGDTAVFVDGYVGYSAPAVTGGGFVDSVNRVVNVIVDGARRIAVWAHTSVAERAAERAEAALETVEDKIGELDRVMPAVEALESGIENAVTINGAGNWQVGNIDKGVRAQGPAGQSGAEVQYHVIQSASELPTDEEHCSSLHRYILQVPEASKASCKIKMFGDYYHGGSTVSGPTVFKRQKPIWGNEEELYRAYKPEGVESPLEVGQLLAETINADDDRIVDASCSEEGGEVFLTLTAREAGEVGNHIGVRLDSYSHFSPTEADLQGAVGPKRATITIPESDFDSLKISGETYRSSSGYTIVQAINADEDSPVLAYMDESYTIHLTAKEPGDEGNRITVEKLDTEGGVIGEPMNLRGGQDEGLWQYVWADNAWVRLPLNTSTIATEESHGLVKLGTLGGWGNRLPVQSGGNGGLYVNIPSLPALERLAALEARMDAAEAAAAALAGRVAALEGAGYVSSESVEHVEVVDELPASPDAGTLYIQTAE